MYRTLSGLWHYVERGISDGATLWHRSRKELLRDLGYFNLCVIYITGKVGMSGGFPCLICPDGTGGDVNLRELFLTVSGRACRACVFIIDTGDAPLPEAVAASLVTHCLPRNSLLAFSRRPWESFRLPHHIYAFALARHITEPDITVEELFKRVREDVSWESDGLQIPWECGMLTSRVSLSATCLAQDLHTGRYAAWAVRRADFEPGETEKGRLFRKMLSKNFKDNRDALSQLLNHVGVEPLTRDQQFLLGRLCFNAAWRHCRYCRDFLEDGDALASIASGYPNPFLSGALYEMFFDENARLRQGQERRWTRPNPCFDATDMLWRHLKDQRLTRSFLFIDSVLRPFGLGVVWPEREFILFSRHINEKAEITESSMDPTIIDPGRGRLIPLLHEERETEYRGETLRYTAWFYEDTDGDRYTTTESDEVTLAGIHARWRERHSVMENIRRQM